MTHTSSRYRALATILLLAVTLSPTALQATTAASSSVVTSSSSPVEPAEQTPVIPATISSVPGILTDQQITRLNNLTTNLDAKLLASIMRLEYIANRTKTRINKIEAAQASERPQARVALSDALRILQHTSVTLLQSTAVDLATAGAPHATWLSKKNEYQMIQSNLVQAKVALTESLQSLTTPALTQTASSTASSSRP